MASEPQEFIRIEESIAEIISRRFNVYAKDLSDTIADYVAAKQWAQAYEEIRGFNLVGVIDAHRAELTDAAVQAVLFGASNVVDLADTDIVKSGVIPQQVHDAVNQLIVACEGSFAETIRNELLATVQAEEIASKDALHDVSKAELQELYWAWNDSRPEYARALGAYIEVRDVYSLQDVAFAWGNWGFDHNLCCGPAGLQYAMTQNDTVPSALQFKGNRFPAKGFECNEVPFTPDASRFLQYNGTPIADADPIYPTSYGTPIGVADPAYPPLSYEDGDPEVPTSSGEIEMGDAQNPSYLQIGSRRISQSGFSVLQGMGVRWFNAINKDDDLATSNYFYNELANNGGLLEPEQAQDAPPRKKKKRKLAYVDLVAEVLRVAKSDTLYVHRDLLNTSDVHEWAKDQGFTSALPDGDMHVTLCYSKKPVNDLAPMTDNLTVEGGPRKVSQFGDATVLQFSHPDLTWRNLELSINGATSDFDQYAAHVTITYDSPLHISSIEPYTGPLEFGPEVHEELTPKGFSPDDLTEHVLKVADLALAAKFNAATLGTGKMVFDAGANVTTSRLISFGFLSQAQGKHTQYQISEVLDDVTCPVCMYMHGKVFNVAQTYSMILQALGTSDPAELKSTHPWPKQSKAGLASLYAMSLEQLQAAGFDCPPFHPRCRGHCVVVGTVTETHPVGSLAQQVQEIINGLTPSKPELVDVGTKAKPKSKPSTSAPEGDDYKPQADQEAVDAAFPTEVNPDEILDKIFGPSATEASAIVEPEPTPLENYSEPKKPAIDEPLPEAKPNAPYKPVNETKTVGKRKKAIYLAANDGEEKAKDAINAAIAALAGSDDYAPAFMANVTSDYALLDAILKKNAINVALFYGDAISKYDETESRDETGKWTAGGISNTNVDSSHDTGLRANGADSSGNQPTPDKADAEKMRGIASVAKDVAEELGFDPAKIVVTDERRTFVLGDKTMYYAGSADISPTRNGEITLYASALNSVDDVVGVTAHEIEHVKFENVLDRVAAERALVEKVVPPNGADYYDTVMNEQGELRAPYDKAFPITAAWHKTFRSVDTQLLAQSDGVSAYSKQYWDLWHKGEMSTHSAIHETLAEMASYKTRNNGAYPEHTFSGPLPRKGKSKQYPEGFASSAMADKIVEKGAKAWRKIYELVDKISATKGNPYD